ncbi:hypothetical protein TCAL_03982 [Tigriopus californicus]|uniref:Aminotransferase class I/classII large domain-containing protein n=1 Tax=Tigriopus californicus TaxID=6832 RepID=A0A553NFX4_TIGCA|nr:kynurenine/alpha-aminoadipate aminotransferase, mitochondrial-like [Tigriopus californicus]TRY64269.1 hypothetical protein TCAL_03982 [Tigriopus californicus]|eukprot:TCALIF_03982-PA protein Name:"Similar to AADAT Kynurenine/alpha-aminoadipate aminotransferase, mitochondrial (Bos taurus)" AED:0.01 eAED:0.01 QI:0/-1/0/1/-1/1/1/0/420
MNYARFINQISARRQPSIIREITKMLANAPPTMIPLSGGLPNPAMFPFMEASFKLNDGSQFSLKGNDMKQALQYISTNGLESLVHQLKLVQETVHNLPGDFWSNRDLIVTHGSQDGLAKAFEMTMNQGEGIIVEEFIYSGTLAILSPYQPDLMVIKNDKDGMIPSDLREKLAQAKTIPKLIYLNPTGANPTGYNLTAERRREIYQICSKYDILIFEDDPYYFLQFGESRIPSFLSMDTDGRVLRFDSFSKILSSGIRLGFLSGPRPLMNRIVLHMQSSLIHASSLSQVITNELFKQWGTQGFLDHVHKVEQFYRQRRDCMSQAADKHLAGLCEWSIPEGGMFLWIKVHGVEDTWDMILEHAFKKEVSLLPGKPFMAEPNKPCSYLRAAFSLASEKDIDLGFQRLAEVIREEHERQSIKKK